MLLNYIMSVSESIQLYLDSYYGTKRLGNAGDTIYQLPIINVPNDSYIHLSVVSCIIPYSFYNINTNNNVLKYNLIGTEQQFVVTVPVGNYNINQLISYLNANMGNDMQMSYNSISNKVTFSNIVNQFALIHTELLRNLGFPDGYSSFYVTSVTPAHCVNLYTVTNISLETNLMTYNVTNIVNQRTNSAILANIPVVTNPNGLVFYENLSQYKTNLYVGELSILNIRLLDNRGKLIDLNGCDYTITLQIDSVPY